MLDETGTILLAWVPGRARTKPWLHTRRERYERETIDSRFNLLSMVRPLNSMNILDNNVYRTWTVDKALKATGKQGTSSTMSIIIYTHAPISIVPRHASTSTLTLLKAMTCITLHSNIKFTLCTWVRLSIILWSLSVQLYLLCCRLYTVYTTIAMYPLACHSLISFRPVSMMSIMCFTWPSYKIVLRHFKSL